MHTPHSLTHPHSLYPTNYTSLTFTKTHSQSSFKAHSSHIHTLTLSPCPHSAHSSHIHTQTHLYFNAHSSHILKHAHTPNFPLMHTPLTLTHFDFPWHVTLRRRGAPQRIQNLTLSQSFTFFEASTKCYPPLVESPLWLSQSFTLFDTHSDIVIFYMNDKIRSILNDHFVTAIPIDKIMYKTFKM